MASSNYTVLARKYRPKTFRDVFGQTALVQTLENSIKKNRLAHAFIFTGVRGVGKTTTARIMARALNCLGKDGKGNMTVDPCGVCASCTALDHDRHVDVIEVDAASRTGVDDVRDIIDSLQYKPVAGRYKIYIIDEVHMLSKNAFNALLKTLEEPPGHAKFIFATTEIRKVPVTILSRCQRFDLKRFTAAKLTTYFTMLLEKEKVTFEPAAVVLIAQAADGSVRDGLTLMDQAINMGDGQVQEAIVHQMLGLGRSHDVLQLLDNLFQGEIKQALAAVESMYRDGVDPLLLLQDLMHWVHQLSLKKAQGDSIKELGVTALEGVLLNKVSIPLLTRAWQVLLKGWQEMKTAPHALKSLQMVLIRFAYLKDVPSLSALLSDEQRQSSPTVLQAEPAQRTTQTVPQVERHIPSQSAPSSSTQMPLQAIDVKKKQQLTPDALENLRLFVQYLETQKAAILASQVERFVHVITLTNGHLAVRYAAGVPTNLNAEIKKHLSAWIDVPWTFTLSTDEGHPTLLQCVEKERTALVETAKKEPMVKALLETFPGAEIESVTARSIP